MQIIRLEGWGMSGDLRFGPKFSRDERIWSRHFGPRLTLGKYNCQTLLSCVKALGCLSFNFTFDGNTLVLERIPRDRYSVLLDLLSINRAGTPGTVSGSLEITSLGGYSVAVKKCDPAAQAAVRGYLASLSPLLPVTGTGSGA